MPAPPSNMTDFFGVYDRALDGPVCRSLIERFEADPRKRRGCVGNGSARSADDPRLARCTEVLMDHSDWNDVRETLLNNLREYVRAYIERWAPAFVLPLRPGTLRMTRCEPGEPLDWHPDLLGAGANRVLTARWYLNTVQDGGDAEYPWYGFRIHPVEGRLLLAPVGWTFLHRGNPPVTGPKYAVVTQLRPVFEIPHTAPAGDVLKNT